MNEWDASEVETAERAAAGGRAVRVLVHSFVIVVILAISPFTPEVGAVKDLALHWTAGGILVWCAIRPGALPSVLRSGGVPGLLAAFVFLNVVAAAFSHNPFWSVSELLPVLSRFVVFLGVAAAFRTVGDARALLRTACLATAVASLYGWLQILGLDPFPWLDTTGMLEEAPATFGNPNFASHVLVLVFIVSVGWSVTGGGRYWLAFTLISALHLGVTQTRGSLVALAAALAVVAIAWWLQRRRVRVGWGVAATVGGAAALLSLAAAIGMYIAFQRTGSPVPYDESISLRYSALHGAVRMVWDRPALGFGPGGFELHGPAYWSEIEGKVFDQSGRVNDHVHNDPVEAVVEGGLLAGIIYVSILASAFHGALVLAFGGGRQRGLGLVLAGLSAAFAVDGIFGFNFHTPAAAALLFVGLGLLVWNREAGSVPSPTPPNKFGGATHKFGGARHRAGGAILFAVFGIVLALTGTAGFVGLVYEQSGAAALRLRYPVEAERLLGIAQVWRPYDWRVAFRLGEAHSAQGEWRDAVEAYDRTLRLNPTHVPAMIGAGRSLVNLGEDDPVARDEAWEKARLRARAALELYPGLREPHGILGRLLAAKGVLPSTAPAERRAALEEAERELVIASERGGADTADTLGLLARVRSGMGEFRSADTTFCRALQEGPLNWSVWEGFYGYARDNNRASVFVNTLDWRIRRQREQPPQLAPVARLEGLRGRALLELRGRVAEARETFNLALSLSPLDMRIWRWASGLPDAEFAPLVEEVSRELPTGAPLPLLLARAAVFGEAGAFRESVKGLVEAIQNRAVRDPEEVGWAVEFASRRAPKSPVESRLGLAYVAANIGRHELVEPLLEGLKDLEGADYASAVSLRADSLFLSGRVEESFRVLDEAASQRAELRLLAARYRMRAERWAEARVRLEALLREEGLDENVRRQAEADLQKVNSEK